MEALIDNMNRFDACHAQRESLYDDFAVENSSPMGMQAFRQDLLKHLAGNIVVKEHKIRYQKE